MKPVQMNSSRRSFHRAALRSAIVAATALLCCGQASTGEPPPAGIVVPDSTVLLTGSINQSMLDRFNQALKEHDVTTVMIASPGGDERISMQIAEAVQARGMDVVVHGLCLGTCAEYIFIAGHGRRVEDQSLVSFGSSASGLASLMDAVGENVPDDFQPSTTWRDFAATEARLYRQAGVSGSLFLDTQIALQPSCVVFRRSAGKPSGRNLSTAFGQWVPTRKYLASVGVAFEGYWPKSHREMTRIANRLTATSRKTELSEITRFGDEDHLERWADAKVQLKNLKACALEEDSRPSASTDGAPATH